MSSENGEADEEVRGQKSEVSEDAGDRSPRLTSAPLASSRFARARLAERQARLVAALGGQGELPDGFDPDRIALTARTLASKRRKGVARAWPILATSLGVDFADLFDTFASAVPPPPDGPAEDALSFARWLDARRRLPHDAAPGLLAARLIAQRFPLTIAVRRQPGRRLLVGVRLPWMGARVWSVPLVPC